MEKTMTPDNALIEQIAVELLPLLREYARNTDATDIATAALAIAKPAIEARTLAAYEARVNAIADTMRKNEWPLFGHVDRSTVETEMRSKAPLTPTGWNPMSTAPHTGEIIDLLNDDYSVTERVFWGQREMSDGELVQCWIRDTDRHAYVTGEYRFIGWKYRTPEQKS